MIESVGRERVLQLDADLVQGQDRKGHESGDRRCQPVGFVKDPEGNATRNTNMNSRISME
jgi:hypothetical protein